VSSVDVIKAVCVVL